MFNYKAQLVNYANSGSKLDSSVKIILSVIWVKIFYSVCLPYREKKKKDYLLAFTEQGEKFLKETCTHPYLHPAYIQYMHIYKKET